MWKVLHQWVKPEQLCQIYRWYLPGLALAAAITLLLSWVWGFGFAPQSHQKSDSVHIMYLYVPAAMGLMGIYVAMVIADFIGLLRQIKIADWGKSR